MINNENRTKSFKLLLLIAAVLIVVGVAGAWLVVDSVSSGNTVTLEEEINIAGVDHVSVRTSIQRVRVRPVDGDVARVVSSGIPANATLIVEVENGALTVETRMPRQFNVGINFSGFRQLTDSPTLDVYLPAVVYEQVTINSTTGRVEIANFAINDLQIEVTTGGIEISDIFGNVNARTTTGRITASGITGENLRFRATTGNVELTDMVGNVNAETSTGRITAAGVIGDELSFRATTGNVELSHVTGHIEGQTNTGRITFNNETVSQNVNLQATTGNISVNLEREPENAIFSLSTTTGRTTIFGDNSSSQRFGDSRYEVTLRTTTGRITVE